MLRRDKNFRRYALVVLILAVVSWWLWSNTFFALSDKECAVVLRLGEIVKVLNSPGTYYIIPVIDTVYIMEKAQVVHVSIFPEETQSIIVRIVDPGKFFTLFGGRYDILESRLSSLLTNHQRSGGTLETFIRNFNNGGFSDLGVSLE